MVAVITLPTTIFFFGLAFVLLVIWLWCRVVALDQCVRDLQRQVDRMQDEKHAREQRLAEMPEDELDTRIQA